MRAATLALIAALMLSAGCARDGVPAGTWLTRRLWGSALTTPWLRTGSAMTVDEAIVMHGGEAAVAARKFALLSEAEQIDLRLFLASLARAPSVRIR